MESANPKEMEILFPWAVVTGPIHLNILKRINFFLQKVETNNEIQLWL
jgi:hypothetical protein